MRPAGIHSYVTEHSTPPSDVLAALRAATAERHAVLDRAMPLAQDAPTIADYRDHLRILRAWLTPLEQWLAGFDDGPQDATLLPAIRRTPALQQDLVHPSMPSGGVDVADIDAATLRAEAAFRWGVCYVIEGSQLGGAVLYRQLGARLAPHPLQFLGAGQSPGPRWQQFLQALRAGVQAPADIALACDGARHAFDALLARVPHHAPSAA